MLIINDTLVFKSVYTRQVCAQSRFQASDTGVLTLLDFKCKVLNLCQSTSYAGLFRFRSEYFNFLQ